MRFTEPNKWSDPWFSELSPTAKLVFLYLCDTVDNAGFREFSPKHFTFNVGISKEELMAAIEELRQAKDSGRRSVILSKGWIFLSNFTRVQKNWPINPKNPAHRGLTGLFNAQRARFSDVPEFMEMIDQLFSDREENPPESQAAVMSREELRHAKKDWGKERDACLISNTNPIWRNDAASFEALSAWWDHRMEMGDPLGVPMWRTLIASLSEHEQQDVISAIKWARANGAKSFNPAVSRNIRLEKARSEPPAAAAPVALAPEGWRERFAALYPDAATPASFFNLPASIQKNLYHDQA